VAFSEVTSFGTTHVANDPEKEKLVEITSPYIPTAIP
jgi:hypothetical protein